MELHLTIKAKLLLSSAARETLRSTMEEFNRACNTLSELAFVQNLHRRYDIHHAGYRLIRQETNLPAQHVINAIAKVGAACLRDSDLGKAAMNIPRSIQPRFLTRSAI